MAGRRNIFHRYGQHEEVHGEAPGVESTSELSGYETSKCFNKYLTSDGSLRMSKLNFELVAEGILQQDCNNEHQDAPTQSFSSDINHETAIKKDFSRSCKDFFMDFNDEDDLDEPNLTKRQRDLCDLKMFLATEPPPLTIVKDQSPKSKSPDSKRSPVKYSATPTKSWWKSQASNPSRKARRNSFTPSTSSTSFGGSVGSPFDTNSSKFVAESPPTPQSPTFIATFAAAERNVSRPRDRSPPPRFFLPAAESSTSPKHEPHSPMELPPVRNSVLNPLRIDFGKYEVEAPSANDKPTQSETRAVEGNATRAPTILAPVISNNGIQAAGLGNLNMSSKVSLGPAMPGSPSFTGTLSSPSTKEPPAPKVNVKPESKFLRRRKKFQIFIGDRSQSHLGASNIDTLDPLPVIKGFQSTQDLLELKNGIEKKKLKSPASKDRFDKFLDSTKAITRLVSSPHLPKDRPADGYPLVRPNSLPEKIGNVEELRIKLGIGRKMVCVMARPRHPKHMFVWEHKNLWCSQCVLDPTEAKIIHQHDGLARHARVTISDPSTGIIRSTPVKCQLCDEPCCVWAKYKFVLFDTARTSPTESDSGGAISRLDDEKRAELRSEKRDEIRVRIEARDAISSIEELGCRGKDEPTFLNCTECDRLVCPCCCGICPEELCHLVLCKACATGPDWKCSLHNDDTFEFITPSQRNYNGAFRRVEQSLAMIDLEYAGERRQIPLPPKGTVWELPHLKARKIRGTPNE